MELKEGMYVRTKIGIIGKIISIDKDSHNNNIITIFNGKFHIIHNEIRDEFGITKASYNIIDLIEVGDYVNGSKIIKTNCKLEYIDDDSDTGVNEVYDGLETEKGWIYFEYEIETIVTKEQFESMSYKVDDAK